MKSWCLFALSIQRLVTREDHLSPRRWARSSTGTWMMSPTRRSELCTCGRAVPGEGACVGKGHATRFHLHASNNLPGSKPVEKLPRLLLWVGVPSLADPSTLVTLRFKPMLGLLPVCNLVMYGFSTVCPFFRLLAVGFFGVQEEGKFVRAYFVLKNFPNFVAKKSWESFNSEKKVIFPGPHLEASRGKGVIYYSFNNRWKTCKTWKNKVFHIRMENRMTFFFPYSDGGKILTRIPPVLNLWAWHNSLFPY